MNIHERVELAVQNAPVTDDFVESTNELSPFTDKDDDYVLHLNRKIFPDLPNEVTLDAENEAGLRQLFEAYVAITDIRLDQEYIDYAQRHEYQHFDAAKMLGALSAQVGVRIFSVQQPGQESLLSIQPFLQVQDFKTTKLGAALVSGYPVTPSKGDQMDIKAYGYSGIDELADRAIRLNSTRKNPATEQFYPVPLGSSLIKARIFALPQESNYGSFAEQEPELLFDDVSPSLALESVYDPNPYSSHRSPSNHS